MLAAVRLRMQRCSYPWPARRSSAARAPMSQRAGRAPCRSLSFVAILGTLLGVLLGGAACSAESQSGARDTPSAPGRDDPARDDQDGARRCTAGDLLWAWGGGERRCAGPWLYRRFHSPCFAASASGEICGFEERHCLRSCYHAAPGAEVSWEFFEQEEVGNPAYRPPTVNNTWRPAAELPAATLWSLRQELRGEVPALEFQVVAVRFDRIENGHAVTYRLRHLSFGEHPVCGAWSTMCRYPLVCRSEAHGLAVDPAECGLDPQHVLSAPGQTAEEVRRADPLSSPVEDGWRCTSLQDLSETRDATSPAWLASQLFAPENPRLRGASLAPEVAPGFDAPFLARQRQLFFELHYEVLSDAQRALARAAYGAALPWTLAGQCGSRDGRPHGVSDDCLAWGEQHGLAGPLALCMRLLADHVSRAAIVGERGRCFELLRQELPADGAACRQQYVDALLWLGEELTRLP
jgi:hypothetical protein